MKKEKIEKLIKDIKEQLQEADEGKFFFALWEIGDSEGGYLINKQGQLIPIGDYIYGFSHIDEFAQSTEKEHSHELKAIYSHIEEIDFSSSDNDFLQFSMAAYILTNSVSDINEKQQHERFNQAEKRLSELFKQKEKATKILDTIFSFEKTLENSKVKASSPYTLIPTDKTIVELKEDVEVNYLEFDGENINKKTITVAKKGDTIFTYRKITGSIKSEEMDFVIPRTEETELKNNYGKFYYISGLTPEQYEIKIMPQEKNTEVKKHQCKMK